MKGGGIELGDYRTTVWLHRGGIRILKILCSVTLLCMIVVVCSLDESNDGLPKNALFSRYVGRIGRIQIECHGSLRNITDGSSWRGKENRTHNRSAPPRSGRSELSWSRSRRRNDWLRGCGSSCRTRSSISPPSTNYVLVYIGTVRILS